jgi:hypothetical protein
MASAAQDQRLSIEFIGVFSGRPDPVMLVSDSAQAQAILDSLAVRVASNTTCAMTDLVALSYNGVRLSVTDPVLGNLTVTVRDGCVSNGAIDLDRNLERLAVSTAFRYDDLDAPGGPKPSTYLGCLVPASLHPDIAPCATASVRQEQAVPAPGRIRPSLFTTAPRSATLDGKRTGPQASGLSWSILLP